MTNPLLEHDLREVFKLAEIQGAHEGWRDCEIRARYGLSAVRFFQAVSWLIQDPEVYAKYPMQAPIAPHDSRPPGCVRRSPLRRSRGWLPEAGTSSPTPSSPANRPPANTTKTPADGSRRDQRRSDEEGSSSCGGGSGARRLCR